jgi:MoxR-like ATPase
MDNALKITTDKSNKTETLHFKKFIEEARRVIYGKDHELKLAFAVLLARGHLLIEDIPGMGKTTFVSCLAKLLGLKMNRIQFTNDLLPADILGANIFDPKTNEFRFVRGPIFAEIVLGDELNRASPKSQSAFLQAMEERTVSIDGKSHALPDPFFIIATQNPQSQVGTYALPESQLDRFLMRISLGYPNRSAETELLKGGNPRDRIENLPQVLSREQLLKTQQVVAQVHASEAIIHYVQELLIQARAQNHPLSPRAGLLLLQAARAWAYIDGREYLIPEDIQDVASPVLTHRLAKANESTIEKLITEIPVP